MMTKSNILELEIRDKIYNFLQDYPGLHVREISRKLDIPFSTLKYHLNYLEKNELIISEVDDKYNRYFISQTIGNKEKKILNFLRKRATLHIVIWFIIAVQCSQKDMGRFLGKHPATISFHLRKMKNAGIIEEVTISNGVISKEELPRTIERPKVSSEKIYVLKDHWMIYNLLKKYKDKLQDNEIVSGIIDYVEFYISEGIPKQIQNREDTISSVDNIFFKMFPPSFCS